MMKNLILIDGFTVRRSIALLLQSNNWATILQNFIHPSHLARTLQPYDTSLNHCFFRAYMFVIYVM